MHYRRVYAPGGSYFFTIVTENRQKILVGNTTINVLREAFRRVMVKRPFRINAAVVMPDHLHCIWSLPSGDHDFSTRWRLIKTWFTKHCNITPVLAPNKARKRKGEQAIWQHRYWEHLLRDEQDFNRHVEYIHYNPVKHGYVRRPFDWEYSSFRHYVRRGVYSEDWGSKRIDFSKDVGRE